MPNKIEVWEHSFPLCNPLSNHKVFHGVTLLKDIPHFCICCKQVQDFFLLQNALFVSVCKPTCTKKDWKARAREELHPPSETKLSRWGRMLAGEGCAFRGLAQLVYKKLVKKSQDIRWNAKQSFRSKWCGKIFSFCRQTIIFFKPRVIHLMLQLPSQDHLQLFHHPDAHFLRTPCNKGRMCHQLNCREHRMKFAHADVDGVLPVAAVWGHNTARNLMEEGQTSQQAGFIFDYAKHIYIYILVRTCTYTLYIYTSTYTDTHIYIYIRLHIQMHIYTHIHVHIYTHRHTHTYITYIDRCIGEQHLNNRIPC